MSLLKQPDEMAFHDTTSMSREFLESLDTGLSIELGDNKLRDIVQQVSERVQDALDGLQYALRRTGFLPAGGNVELAEVKTVALKAKVAVSNEPDGLVVATKLADEARELQQTVNEAIASLPPDHVMMAEMRAYAETLQSVAANLRARTV
jgi:hypothetical protein